MNYVKIFSSMLAIALLVVGCGLTKGNVVEPKPQATCPVMGDKIACLILDKDIYIDYGGKRIYFCSKGCLKKFKKDPEKYIEKMEDQGVVFEETPSGRPKNESRHNSEKEIADIS